MHKYSESPPVKPIAKNTEEDLHALALELARSNVQVNAVAPGIIQTPLHKADEGTRAFLKTLAPSGRTGVEQDIVDAVLYLTDSNFTTGAVLPVDGGMSSGIF